MKKHEETNLKSSAFLTCVVCVCQLAIALLGLVFAISLSDTVFVSVTNRLFIGS